jgi:pimeloyl-ACP methyl ester carboxylesterase
MGTEDRNAPLSAARRLVDRLPDARLVVWDDGGHLTGYREEAEILDELLARCSAVRTHPARTRRPRAP